MRRAALASLAAAGIGFLSPAEAQDLPVPGFIENGIKGLIGGGEKRPPGAYVSPSAAELVPDGADVGATQRRPLQRFEPIPLPGAPGHAGVPAIDLPALPAYAPQNMPSREAIRSRAALALQARLVEDGPPINKGLVWRLFSSLPSLDGKLPMIASAEGGSASFQVPAGSYFLHVGFGRAGVTRRIDFTGLATQETVVLGAGGLKLDAVLPDGKPLPADKLSFDVFDEAGDEHQENLIADDVAAGSVVRLNAGTYHVLSNYGSTNAAVRADIRVEAGKITEATLTHRAALLTMKLVREKGGEAIADTAWSISTASGDLVGESVGAFPTMVLAEGEYVIVAKNRDRIYQREFEVKAGADEDLEVLTSDLVTAPGGDPAAVDAGGEVDAD
ncbi:hypothetical protein [Mangrovicella endophytica]|uniref:hypothetical protein n=1 Tax=Mangrovicella endophytica TaxID=2066697 RepID=UPI0018E406AB|nr:hypothetical protein [Mangrovicella endophytica]